MYGFTALLIVIVKNLSELKYKSLLLRVSKGVLETEIISYSSTEYNTTKENCYSKTKLSISYRYVHVFAK